jgi:Ni,Fe-hydrogenase I large subunit
MSTAIDGNEPEAVINPERITLFNELAARAQTFVQQVYVPDVLAVASFYKEWFGYGEGLGNFMAYGDLPSGSINDPAGFFFPRGVILDRDLSTVHPIDPEKIAEYVTHSWCEYSVGDQASRRPAQATQLTPVVDKALAVLVETALAQIAEWSADVAKETLIEASGQLPVLQAAGEESWYW